MPAAVECTAGASLIQITEFYATGVDTCCAHSEDATASNGWRRSSWGRRLRRLFVARPIASAAAMRICRGAALKLHVRPNVSAKFLDTKQGDA